MGLDTTKCDLHQYLISVNGDQEPFYLLAHSLGHALRQAGDLDLQDTDTISIRRDPNEP